jgi:hypothetical protein
MYGAIAWLQSDPQDTVAYPPHHLQIFATPRPSKFSARVTLSYLGFAAGEANFRYRGKRLRGFGMFTSDADFERADWGLLQNGSVNLFWRPAILAEAVHAIRQLGYEILEVSCRSGQSIFYEQFSDVLHWDDLFGYYPWSGNLDALSDGLADYQFGSAGRSALVLDGFHVLANEDSTYAHGVLDTIEHAARDHLLSGKILIGLVQTDDNHYECSDIGCRGANWNLREWLYSNRGR